MSQDLTQLTKKNQEFIHIATKELIKAGKTDAEIHELLAGILPNIIEHQKEGATARSLYGSPTAWVASLSQPVPEEKPAQNESPFLMWLDTSLLILAFFAVIQGVVSSLSNSPEIYGATTIIASSMVGGLVFYAMYRYVYRFTGQDRAMRPPFWKVFLILTACTLLWIMAFSVTALLPSVINPVLPNLGLIFLGGAAYAAHYLLSKKYNIKSTLQGRQG